MKDANEGAHEAASRITAANDLGPLEAAVMGHAISRMYRRAFPAVSVSRKMSPKIRAVQVLPKPHPQQAQGICPPKAAMLPRLLCGRFHFCTARYLSLCTAQASITPAVPMPESRWAVVSANANSRYAFYLPLVALAWMRVAGTMSHK